MTEEQLPPLLLDVLTLVRTEGVVFGIQPESLRVWHGTISATIYGRWYALPVSINLQYWPTLPKPSCIVQVVDSQNNMLFRALRNVNSLTLTESTWLDCLEGKR